MSDLNAKFLQQLQSDLRLLADDSCAISRRLDDLSSRLDIVDQGRSVAVFFDKDKGRFEIDAGHPGVKTLVNSKTRRRSDVVFFISALASLLNREEESLTDEDERQFHAKLLRFASENVQGSWSA